MKIVGDARALADLEARVEGLTLDAERRWGKMNVQQMLAHLAGAMEWVTGDGEARPWPQKPSKLIKFVALRVPLPWPKGIPNPNDPAGVPVAPEEFDALRKRVLAGLAAMSRWEATDRTPPHPAFGPMSTWEWRRWAWKHADHHLRQFGA
jgi:hypothetical protein